MQPEDDQEEVRAALERGGWRAGHHDLAKVEDWAQRLDKPGGFRIFPAASAALAEYGGLDVKQAGPGRDFARSSFVIDPILALNEESRFREQESVLGARLYPLGEAEGGHAFLAIDEHGRVALFMEDIIWVAPSISEALRCLILGERPRSVR